jgi:hypothetical protein
MQRSPDIETKHGCENGHQNEKPLPHVLQDALNPHTAGALTCCLSRVS